MPVIRQLTPRKPMRGGSSLVDQKQVTLNAKTDQATTESSAKTTTPAQSGAQTTAQAQTKTEDQASVDVKTDEIGRASCRERV